MKLVKRILIAVLIVLVVFIAAAIAIPYFFKDEILVRVKEDLNQNLNAEVDFKDIDLSLLRSFPDFNFRMEEFKVVNKAPFENTTLAAAREAELVLDLMSLIKADRPIEVHRVRLDEPVINIRILKDGTVNYDIVKTDGSTPAGADTSAATSNFLVQLKSYRISDGKISYHDQSADLFVDVEGLNHEGRGDFTQNLFDLSTETSIEKLTAESAGIPYLNKAQAELDAIVQVNLDEMKFTLKDNDLKINDLQLLADGFVQMTGEDIRMDLAFEAPENNFKSLLSLIPYAYTKNYSNVKADGEFAFDGKVNGVYNGEREQYPAFAVNLLVKNAQFKYPDLPLGVSDIFADVKVNSPGSDFDQLKVDVPQLRLKLGNNPIKAAFKLRTPLSDPEVDAVLDGTLNLKELAQAFPMEGIEELNGKIVADVIAKARMSDIDRGAYESVNMKGKLILSDFDYRAEATPEIKIANLAMDFSPRFVQIDQFEAQIGKSDVRAQGRIDNILAYFAPEKTMKGSLSLRSGFFDLNEWMPAGATAATAAPAGTAGTEQIFDRFNFDLEAKVDKMNYDIYELRDLEAKGNLTSDYFKASQFSLFIGESDFAGKGQFTNLFGYAFEGGILGGLIDLRSNFLNLNEFMEESPSARPQAENINLAGELSPYPVPENMDITINANVNRLRYTNLDVREVAGQVLIKEETVFIKEAQGNTLGGKLSIEGSYNTQNIEDPLFDLKYALNGVEFQQAFNTFNTFEKLAPIGQFIKGKLNTNMSFNGSLNKDLMPKFNTLNAEGFLETLNGVIENFKPLEKIGELLDLNYFNTIQLKNTRNWFTVEEGFVYLKETEHEVKDIKMVVSGKHAINQEDMNYLIKTKIPRKLLEKSSVTAAANKGLNLLSKEAAKYGLNIAQGEFVNVNFILTGSITQPKVELKLVGTDGETSISDAATDKLNEVKDKAVDSLRNVADQKLEEAKKKATEAADSAKAAIDKEVNKALDKAKEDAAKKLKDELKRQAADSLKNDSKSKIDTLLGDKNEELKDKLKDLNPFKKKKKNDN